MKIRRFELRRPVIAWLLFVLMVEANCLALLVSWVSAKNELVRITNLVASAPGSDWWIMAINQTLLLVLIGLALLWIRWYGVIAGVAIFLLALPFLAGIL